MNLALIVHPAAEQDIADALDWYGDRAPEQVDRLLSQLSEVMDRIRTSPRLFPTVHGAVRRAALRVFPYFVWFLLDSADEVVVVLAVTHHRRDPAEVRTRLRD